MEKRVVQALLLASGMMFVFAVALACFARPGANSLIWVAGRGSAGMAIVAAVMFAVFALSDRQRVR